MHKGVVDKKNLKKMLATTAKHATVYAPVRRADDVVLAALEATDEVALDYVNFQLPPKRFFFPPGETIGAYDGARLSATLPAEGEFVLFGVRPCDARSLLLLDLVFLEDGCEDPYYSARRERATIVSVSCLHPAQTCSARLWAAAPVIEREPTCWCTTWAVRCFLRPSPPRAMLC